MNELEPGEMERPIKDVGPGFAAFLRREMSCKANLCRWQWFAEHGYHYVHCTACGSAYPWRDTHYLRRIYELETERAADRVFGIGVSGDAE